MREGRRDRPALCSGPRGGGGLHCAGGGKLGGPGRGLGGGGGGGGRTGGDTRPLPAPTARRLRGAAGAPPAADTPAPQARGGEGSPAAEAGASPAAGELLLTEGAGAAAGLIVLPLPSFSAAGAVALRPSPPVPPPPPRRARCRARRGGERRAERHRWPRALRPAVRGRPSAGSPPGLAARLGPPPRDVSGPRPGLLFGAVGCPPAGRGPVTAPGGRCAPRQPGRDASAAEQGRPRPGGSRRDSGAVPELPREAAAAPPAPGVAPGPGQGPAGGCSAPDLTGAVVRRPFCGEAHLPSSPRPLWKLGRGETLPRALLALGLACGGRRAAPPSAASCQAPAGILRQRRPCRDRGRARKRKTCLPKGTKCAGRKWVLPDGQC